MKTAYYIKKTLQIFLYLAICIHLTIKDTFYISSLLFYATPLPLIALGVLFLLFFIKASARRYYVILAVIIALIWYNRSYISSPDAVTENSFEVVLWNAYRNNSFEAAFVEGNSIPDVLVLIEADKENFQKIQQKYPNYHFRLTEKSVGIFSKTPIKIHTNVKTKHHVVIIHFSTKNTHFYAIDVSADTQFFRKNMLQSALSRIKTEDKTIVLGDFNTPY
ncbi:MAG: endonuclease/exonuclease/phosphatase family protein, partial [Bacteroidota bacterium]